MDTESRLEALEAKAKKNSIIIGMLIVLVLWIAFDLKLHTVLLRIVGIEINDMDKEIRARKKSNFDAYQIIPEVKKFPNGIDTRGGTFTDTTMLS